MTLIEKIASKEYMNFLDKNEKEYADRQNIKETVIRAKLNLFIGHDYRDSKNILEAKNIIQKLEEY